MRKEGKKKTILGQFTSVWPSGFTSQESQAAVMGKGSGGFLSDLRAASSGSRTHAAGPWEAQVSGELRSRTPCVCHTGLGSLDCGHSESLWSQQVSGRVMRCEGVTGSPETFLPGPHWLSCFRVSGGGGGREER